MENIEGYILYIFDIVGCGRYRKLRLYNTTAEV